MIVHAKRLRNGATLPTYATSGSAGLDLYACLDQPLVLARGCILKVPTGVSLAIPSGYVGLIRDRSSLAIAGIHTIAGVIDSDYRGEILVAVYYVGAEGFTIQNGDRIAQMLIVPCPAVELLEVDELPPTKRGAGGFGSTGF